MDLDLDETDDTTPLNSGQQQVGMDQMLNFEPDNPFELLHTRQQFWYLYMALGVMWYNNLILSYII